MRWSSWVEEHRLEGDGTQFKHKLHDPCYAPAYLHRGRVYLQASSAQFGVHRTTTHAEPCLSAAMCMTGKVCYGERLDARERQETSETVERHMATRKTQSLTPSTEQHVWHGCSTQERSRHVCSDLACCRGVDCVVDAADNAPSEKPWVDIERKTSQRRASAQGTGIMNCRTLH